MESVIEEEEHLPQTGMTSHAAAQLADIAKFSLPSDSPSTAHKQLAQKLKAKANNKRMKGQRLIGSLK